MLKRLLFLLLFAASTRAACTGSSPNWTSTPDFSSVSTCLTNATRNTDTITVTAGSATWASTLTITKGVKLLASGTVTLSPTTNIPFITATPDSTAIANGENITIAGFTFNGNATTSIFMELDGASGVSGTKPYRYYIIKNNFFKNQVPGTSDGVITASSANNNGQLRGVISGNDFDRCDIVLRGFSNNDTGEWANTNFNQLAYGTQDSLYFETNNIHWSSSYSGGNPGWIEMGQGGRIVIRYNTWNQTNATTPQETWDIHGFQNWNGTVNSGQTSTMIVEDYGNTLSNMGTFRWINMRGSWGLFFDNILTGSGANTIDLYGMSSGASCPSDINPTPVGYNPLVNNTYFFNNTQGGTNTLASPFGGGSGKPSGCTVTENNAASVGSLGSTSQGGWWNQNASCTTSACSAGVGQGTTAPTGTCATGTGFWVASTPTATTSSAVIQSAHLYKCTATNTWTNYYTPFTYPHPLLATAAPPASSPAIFVAVPLPSTTTTPVTITSLIPTQSYVTSKGCSQDGVTWNLNCPVRVMCGGCSATTLVTLDGKPIVGTWKSGEMDVNIPLAMLPIPTSPTPHTFLLTNLPQAVPTLQ